MKSAHDLSTAPSEPARTRLGISDLPYSLDTAKMARIERAVRLCPLTVADRTRPGFTRADWRDLMRKVVIRLFPHAYIYAGGSHIAVHATPPFVSSINRYGRPQHPDLDGQAGICLFRIIEIKLPANTQP